MASVRGSPEKQGLTRASASSSLLLLLAPSGLGACVRAEFVRFHARLWATERMHLPKALSAWCVAVRAWYEDSWRC